jgi:predicted TIM-barrel fold metal-dependent hydrolase
MQSSADSAKLAQWRAGMTLLSTLPQVRVKLSMIGYALPGWHRDAGKAALAKALVLEVIAMFGAERCMFSR